MKRRMPAQPVPVRKLSLPTLAATRKWGRALGRAISEGPVFIALDGELGAGKTTLVRAIGEGLKLPEPAQVTSPTFAIQHVYEGGRLPVYHFDFYRLGALDELPDIGWDDLLGENAVVIAEWAEKFPEALPPDRIEILLSHASRGRKAKAALVGAAAISPAFSRWLGRS